MKLITTSREGGKWQEREFVFAGGIKSGIPLVIVDETKTYQTHMGFGAAFTEAAALTLREAGAKREEVIRACFGKEGLRYRLGRVPIHSCDFSTGLWTYARENDRELASFDLSHEDELLVPLIKDCGKECGELFLMASPWSPPAWMKENGSMLHGGKLKRDCYSVWADYFVKYILEMEKRGLKIDVVSVQNETEAVQVWESCVYTAEEEAAFVKVLHKAFERAGIAAKIAVVDHNRDIVVNRCLKEFADEEVRSAVWGIAYHWYCSERSENLSLLHALYPEKHIFLSECSVELGGEEIGDWTHAERYGRQIIRDFNHGSEGWIDWNLALDEQGGPNHVGNYCEAPVMYHRKKGEVLYQPSYYYIGHFSRFIEKGAKRIFCETDTDKKLYAVAYKNPNGTLVCAIQNEEGEQEINLVVNGNPARLTLPAHSIQTLLTESSKERKER